MKPGKRGYATRSKLFALGPGMITAIVVVVAVGALWVFAVIDPIRWFMGNPEDSHSGQIAVPVSGMPIPAFNRISRDHLWNGNTGTFSVLYLRPDQVSPEIIRLQSKIIGRVMDHDKPPGYVFTESDFLPLGTKPGLVAGIPAGKRAMRVPTEQIGGLVGLVIGDRFDLISTMPITASAGGLESGGLYGKQLELQASLSNWQKQATVRVIVQRGLIVEPSSTRMVSTSSSSLMNGATTRTKPTQEAVIAVSPSEVALLAEALAVGATISCIPRSGRPEDDPDSITPESEPWSPYGGAVHRPRNGELPGNRGSGKSPTETFGTGFTPVETITGAHREMVAAPVKR